MRIACVENTAAERVSLQKFIDDAFAKCRGSIGHLALAQTYPCSKEEVIVNAAPHVVVVGPMFSVEQSFLCCREIRAAHPKAPLVVLLSAENYSLRMLRRFERVSSDVFSTDETSTRIVHKLSSFAELGWVKTKGKLITITGVKGGVGATSVAVGLAHALEAIGKKAALVDLSLHASLIHYMAPERWHSPDYSAAVVDRIPPDRELLARCLTEAPNGISLLLPPSGGSDVRELWLRDSKRFEISLSLIEIMLEQFDAVLVDIAASEGVLQFALNCRADTRLLVSSNDPASVHLLSTLLNSICESPGEGQVQILVNQLQEKSLTYDDILDFLYCSQRFEPAMMSLEALPFDTCAKNWIGTGNSFYTEAGSKLQAGLERAATFLTLGCHAEDPRETAGKSFLSTLKRLTKRPAIRKQISAPRRALPFLEGEETRLDGLLRPKTQSTKGIRQLEKAFEMSVEGVREVKIGLEETDSTIDLRQPGSADVAWNISGVEKVYGPPKKIVNER
jgi:cellulose biosynthesis protein BcsQ